MPQIKLNIGPMDLESDPTSTKDGVLAHLINGYTVGEAVRMWPGMAEYLDLGTGKPVWLYYSSLHGVTLAVSDGRLFKITDTATEVTGATLTADVPPTFAEDKDYIFIAARSSINTYTPATNTVVGPRAAIDPVYSNLLEVATLQPSLALTHFGIDSNTTTTGTLLYSVSDVDGTHFKVEKSISGGAWSTVSADEEPGEEKTFTYNPGLIVAGTYNVKIRITDLADGSTVITSPAVKLLLSGTLTPNTAPTFSTQPIVTSTSETALTIAYGTTDPQSNHYKLRYSTDNGMTWLLSTADETPGDGKTYTIEDLEPGTEYKVRLRIEALTGNKTIIDSYMVRGVTAIPEATNTPGPLTFTTQPTASDVSSTGVTINYSTADTGGYLYQLEVSQSGGGQYTVQELTEQPGDNLSFLVSGLNEDTTYYFRLKLTSQDNQSPVNVTSLAYMAGFLIANGEAQDGAVPGDFGYSDNIGYTKWSFENNASSPDPLQAIIATPNRELVCIGTQSTDFNVLGGTTDNPFTAEVSAALAYGTPAPHSICYDQQSVYYVTTIGGNRQIVRLVNGRTPQVISFPVGVPIGEIEDVSDAVGSLVGFRGQSFYVISFPTANVTIDDVVFPSLTLAFSIRAERWSILGEWDNGYTRYKGTSFVLSDRYYVGGTDGKVYVFDDGTRIDEPTFIHRWRDNGIKEWRLPRVLSLGEVGDRRIPLRSRLCGRYYKRQDELVFADGPYRMAIRTGWRSQGSMIEKTCFAYTYDVKRGDEGIVFNGFEEYVEVVR